VDSGAIRRKSEFESDGRALTILQCLAQFVDEVVRFRPATHRRRRSDSDENGTIYMKLPVLIPHYTALTARKRQMRKRLKAAGLNAYAFFVEMEPDYVNDSMRVCLGPKRRQTIDSMSDNPNWRAPTRGEDSLAVKHLAAALWLLRSQWARALILEDDAWFTQHLAAELDVLDPELENLDWDVIAIGTCYHHRTPFGRQVAPHVWMTQIMPCAHAYLLSRRGATSLLRTLPLQLPIDLQMNLMAQDSVPYEELRNAGAERSALPTEASARIYWVGPQLVFQWPQDVTRSVEKT